MRDHDITWLRLQLTLMRWHLHAAKSVATEAVHQHLERARHVYNVSKQSLSTRQLTYDERREFERGLSALGTELEVRGAPSTVT